MHSAVAVVVPTYNRARLIGETLEAILSQTLAPAEVVVADDGSTDDTAAEVARFGARVRRLALPQRGVCSARNAGIRATSSPLVAFCDSDDLWDPGHLRAHAGLHAAVPALTFSFGNFMRFGAARDLERDGGRDKFAQAPAGWWDDWRPAGDDLVLDEPLCARLLAFQPVFPSTLVVRRRHLERLGGFDERFNRTASEDFEFTLRCARRGPAGAVTRPLVRIRRHEGNFSADQFACLAGEVTILEHAVASHALPASLRGAVLAELRARRLQAIDAGFATGRIDMLPRLGSPLPFADCPPKTALKLAIARLPKPLAEGLRRLLVQD